MINSSTTASEIRDQAAKVFAARQKFYSIGAMNAYGLETEVALKQAQDYAIAQWELIQEEQKLSLLMKP